MAIIYSYPPKPSPSLSDQVLITDSESDDPNNATRNTTVGEILTQKGTGTAGTIPKWLNSNILTDSFIITSGNNMSIPGYIARTGFPDTYFGYEPAGDSKSIALVSNGKQTVRSIHDGTNSYGWIGYNGVTSLFATSTGAKLQGDYFDIPKYIRHAGDTDSFFGFKEANSFILDTESGTKIAAGPDNVTLYSDTSETATTTSVARLATATTGVLVYGQTVAAGAASERGGIIRYYNNANDRYVGIAGPITQGTNYQIRLPDTIGTVGQVLAIASIDGINAVMQWADSTGGRTCALTVTSTVTDETIPGANDGAVSIDISGGLANYAVVVTHADGVTTKSSTSSSTPVVITGLKSGAWTITGDDNEPSGVTKCPITGTFSVQAGTCSLSSSISDIQNATDVTIQNGSAKATFTGYLSNVNMTLTDSEGKYPTQTFSGITNTFTGLGVGTWTLTGTDSGNSCTSTPVTFAISANLTITQKATGLGYVEGDVYSMTTTKGTGSGMRITCKADGSEPVIVAAGDGGYETGDTVEARDNVTDPTNPPDIIAGYSVTNNKPA